MSSARHGRWADAAREAIAHVIRESRAAGLDVRATIAAIDAAYPFGERAYHPYKVWLVERRRAIGALEMGAGEEMLRPCPACGAGPGRPCRTIGDDDVARGDTHQARRA